MSHHPVATVVDYVNTTHIKEKFSCETGVMGIY